MLSPISAILLIIKPNILTLAKQSLPGAVDLSIELYLLLLKHLLQDLRGLRLAVGVIEVGLVDSLEEEMYLFWGFGAVGVEDAEDEAFDDVSQVALHRGAFFQQRTLHVIIDIVLNGVLIGSDRLVVDNFSVLERVQSADTGSVFGHPGLLQHSLMHPKRHLLLQNIMGYLQLIAQFLRTDAVPIVLDLLLIKGIDHDGLDRQALEVKIAILEGKREVDVAEVVVVEDLTHGLDLREDFGVFVEDGL